MKRLIALLLTVVMALACTGCSILLDVNTSINKNGSGSITLALGVDTELYGVLSQSDGSYSDEMKPMTIGGQEAFGTSVSISFDSYDELNALMTGDIEMDGYHLDTLFTEFKASRKGVDATINDELYADSFSELQTYGISFRPTYSFTFEQKIKEANGVISDDGHTVVYTAFDTGEIEIRLKQSPLPYILIAVGLIVVAAVVLLLVKGKKSKKPAPADESADAAGASVAGDADIKKDASTPDNA